MSAAGDHFVRLGNQPPQPFSRIHDMSEDGHSDHNIYKNGRKCCKVLVHYAGMVGQVWEIAEVVMHYEHFPRGGRRYRDPCA